jgi:hypothetical protein
MKRRVTVAVLAVACAAVPSVEAKTLPVKYHVLRERIVEKHGARAPGRNIVRQGVRTKRGSRAATNTDIAASIATFRRMLAPPPPPAPAPSSSSTSTTPTAGLQSAGSGGACGAIPGYIVGRESGGDPNAVNPSSGAFGCYQLLPDHFAAGGECAGLGTDQAGQDECAGRLWDGGAGSSHWAQTR